MPMSPETRQRVTSAGGKSRGQTMTGAELTKLGKAGAAKLHSLPGIAQRLVNRWAQATPEEQDEARRILAELP